jgi:hypothetical protein
LAHYFYDTPVRRPFLCAICGKQMHECECEMKGKIALTIRLGASVLIVRHCADPASSQVLALGAAVGSFIAIRSLYSIVEFACRAHLPERSHADMSPSRSGHH